MNLSDFGERPRFYLNEKQKYAAKMELSEKMEIPAKILKPLILKELIRQIQIQVSGQGLQNNRKSKLKARKRKGKRF